MHTYIHTHVHAQKYPQVQSIICYTSFYYSLKTLPFIFFLFLALLSHAFSLHLLHILPTISETDLIFTPNIIMSAGKSYERLPSGRYVVMIMLVGSTAACRKMRKWHKFMILEKNTKSVIDSFSLFSSLFFSLYLLFFFSLSLSLSLSPISSDGCRGLRNSTPCF